MSTRWITGDTPNSSIPIGPAATSSHAPSRACQPVAIVIATTIMVAPSATPAASASRSIAGER